MNPSPHSSLSLFCRQIRYVFLDRDGVINQKAPEGEYIDNWTKFQILPGVEDAIASLNNSGRRVIVLTNQRGIQLGRYTSTDVDALHEKLRWHLEEYGAHIDAFYYCPHDIDQCNCRKPKPGLFQQAFHDYPEATPTNTLVIGDSLSDMEGAHRLGIASIFILDDLETRRPDVDKASALAVAVVRSLAEAVAMYLK